MKDKIIEILLSENNGVDDLVTRIEALYHPAVGGDEITARQYLIEKNMAVDAFVSNGIYTYSVAGLMDGYYERKSKSFNVQGGAQQRYEKAKSTLKSHYKDPAIFNALRIAAGLKEGGEG